jgi:hypothetical protein
VIKALGMTSILFSPSLLGPTSSFTVYQFSKGVNPTKSFVIFLLKDIDAKIASIFFSSIF